MDDTEVTCPKCGCEFWLDDGVEKSFDVEDAAEKLLENYQGGHPSTGDVQRLKDKLTEILVSEFGISEGKI